MNTCMYFIWSLGKEGHEWRRGGCRTEIIWEGLGTSDITRRYWLPCSHHPMQLHYSVCVQWHRQLCDPTKSASCFPEEYVYLGVAVPAVSS